MMERLEELFDTFKEAYANKEWQSAENLAKDLKDQTSLVHRKLKQLNGTEDRILKSLEGDDRSPPF